LQHPPQNINILSASDFGYLVICLPENSQMIFSSAPFVHKMRKNLQDFKSNDYILCTGDPAVIGLSTAIASDVTQGKFNLLKWDRQEKRYYPLSFDLYAKGERND
jgi:aspartyl/asparaginyl beta-hydroxylase (cupin superfamily)